MFMLVHSYNLSWFFRFYIVAIFQEDQGVPSQPSARPSPVKWKLRYAVTYPHRVERLCLCAAAPKVGQAAYDNWMRRDW